MKKRFLTAALALILCLSITGCRPVSTLQDFPVLDGTEFEYRLAELGYSGIETTDLGNCTQYLLNDGALEVSLSVYNNKTSAASDFATATSQLEDIMAVHNSLEVGSRGRWSGSTGDEAVNIYLIDNTIVAINGTKAQTTEIVTTLLKG